MYEDLRDPVYYKLYLSHHTDKLTVVCMQSFDEYDYEEHRFYKDNDEILRWDTEAEAIDFLVKNFKPEFVDDEYKSCVIDWASMRK